MIMKKNILILVIALLFLQLPISNQVFGQNFPLKLSSNGRYFVDSDDKPFLINGDTPWLLIQKLTLEEVKFFLDNRVAKKFNTIQIMLNDYHSPVNDLNREGNRPFGNENDFSTIDEAYFLFVDKVITEARLRGLGIIMAPLWRDCCSEGWRPALNANGVTKSRQFGEYLGTRYSRANHPNFIGWMMGGDHIVDDTYDEYKAVAEGIKAKDPGVFLTYHTNPVGKSTDQVSDAWLNLNSVYTQDIYVDSDEAYALTPVMPFYLSEAKYEGLLANNTQDNAAPYIVRRQAYWSILCGSAGHIYGTDAWDVNSNWKEFLDLPGAIDISYMYAFFTSIEWATLVPDKSQTLVTEGFGTYGNDDYVTSALTSDGKVGVAYLASTGTNTRTLTVDMSKLTGTVTAKWFNPNTGIYTTIGSYVNCGSRNFISLGINGESANDWILILDARGYDY